MEKKVFGEFLGKLRVKHNMTQEQLAIHLNVTNKTISKWERGITLPDLEMIIDIADFFHLSTYELVHGIEIKHPLIRIKDKIKITNKKSIKKIAIKNLLSLLAIVMFFIGTILCYVYTFKNYGNVEIYELYSDDEDFSVEGLILKKNNTYYLSLSNVKYTKTTKNSIKNINSITYKLTCNNIFNIIREINFDNNIPIMSALKNINIYYSTELMDTNIKNLELNFKYITNGNYTNSNTIKINLKKI